MSAIIDSERICLDIAESLPVKSHISFTVIKTKEIVVDLDEQTLFNSNNWITYFLDSQEWRVFTEGQWHKLPANSIRTILMPIYKDFDERVQFRRDFI